MEDMGKPQSSPQHAHTEKTAGCISLCRIMTFRQHFVGDWAHLGTIREGFLKEKGASEPDSQWAKGRDRYSAAMKEGREEKARGRVGTYFGSLNCCKISTEMGSAPASRVWCKNTLHLLQINKGLELVRGCGRRPKLLKALRT